jgi:phage terminase large subunit-like protein
MDADPFDESNWYFASPALGDFLNLQAIRDEAAEAKNDPMRENGFRQFRLNQWTSQATRWMPMHTYRECTGDLWLNADWGLKLLAGREAWVGLDLSAKQDLTSLCIFIPPRTGKSGMEPGHAMWWHWLPEDAMRGLDQATNHAATTWVRQGFLRLMPGAVIDYKQLCAEIAQILQVFRLRELHYDKWRREYTRQELERLLGRGATLVATEPTYAGMTIPMQELMAQTVSRAWNHHDHGNRWQPTASTR